MVNWGLEGWANLIENLIKMKKMMKFKEYFEKRID
jgi:hypothetical protein